MVPAWIYRLMVKERSRCAPRGPVRKEDLDEIEEHQAGIPSGAKLAFPGYEEFPKTPNNNKPYRE